MAQVFASELIGSIDVCKRVGIDRSTLSRWIKDGTAVPAGRLPGVTGAYLFTAAEADRLAAWYVERQAASA